MSVRQMELRAAAGPLQWPNYQPDIKVRQELRGLTAPDR